MMNDGLLGGLIPFIHHPSSIRPKRALMLACCEYMGYYFCALADAGWTIASGQRPVVEGHARQRLDSFHNLP
jgi:hypothetical protein